MMFVYIVDLPEHETGIADFIDSCVQWFLVILVTTPKKF